MVKIEIFDPALCCPTGVCGPDVDPELTRIARVITTLRKKGVDIVRHNLSQDPEPYVSNKDINQLLETDGTDSLPATVVNGKLVKKADYPTIAELSEWTEIDESELFTKPKTYDKNFTIDLKFK